MTPSRVTTLIRTAFLAVPPRWGILALALVAWATPAGAGINTWTSSGPEGGAVRALAIDPATPTTLYAATAGGVFKSTNSGGAWAAMNNSLTTLGVNVLAIDPQTPTTI
jgi:hypothetical protein